MMKRPMLQIATACCIGTVLACYIRQVFIVVLIFPVLIFLSWYGATRNIPAAKSFLLYGVFIVFGYANYAFQYTILSKPLMPYYEENVSLAGYVNSECRTENGRVTFEFFIERLENSGKYVGRTILVNVYGTESIEDYTLGARLVLSGVLMSPSASRNPGGFNYKNYLYTKRIPATLSTNGSNVKKTGSAKSLPLKRVGINLRQYILTSLEKNLSSEKSALIGAMLIGYRENLTEQMENAFSAAGLTHIMAVSGANLAFLVFPLLWVLSWIGVDRKVSAVIAIPFIFLYLLVTGLESSVLRASVMAVVILLGKALHRKGELVNSVAVAVFILLSVNPFMFFDVGFQLSVGATLGLGILYKRVRNIFPAKVPGFISETLAATISAQAGVLPLLIMYFSRISLISLVSNMLVVPVTGITTCLGAVCIIARTIHPFLGKITGYGLEAVLHFILFVTDKSASVKWAEIYMHHWDYLLICIYYLLVFLWGIFGINFFRKHKNAVIACVFTAGLVFVVKGIVPVPLKVIFADVGQGDCILIQTPGGRNYLVDGGGAYNEDETGYYGRKIILPMLMHEKISRIDMALVTHAHSDHMSGVLTLIEIFDVKSVGLPDYPGAKTDFGKLVELCESRNIPVVLYNEGDVIRFDDETVFEVLNPPSMNAPYGNNLNNTSLCGMLRFKELSVLFTGDIEAEAEKTLLKYGDGIDCDILKVAHHGGAESTIHDFLRFARPKAAIISVGKNNYGHPSAEVIERLHRSGARIYTTREKGAIIVTSNGNDYRIRSWVSDERYTFFPDDGGDPNH